MGLVPRKGCYKCLLSIGSKACACTICLCRLFLFPTTRNDCPSNGVSAVHSTREDVLLQNELWVWPEVVERHGLWMPLGKATSPPSPCKRIQASSLSLAQGPVKSSEPRQLAFKDLGELRGSNLVRRRVTPNELLGLPGPTSTPIGTE